MNIARKVIISIFVPILIGFPILNISIRTNISAYGEGMSWTPRYLYEYGFVWWLLVLGTAIFLFIFWNRNDKELQENVGDKS